MHLPSNHDEILDLPKLSAEPYPNRDRDNERIIPVYSPQGEFKMDDGTPYQMTSSYGERISSFSDTAAKQDKIYLLTIDGISSGMESDQMDFYDLTYTLYKGNEFCTLEQLVSNLDLSNYAYELIIKTLELYASAEVPPSKNENWNRASDIARRNVIRILEGIKVAA